MKNCGKRFHVYIATKEFMQEMIKIISPKYNPSVELQNTVLSLIQVSFLSVFTITAFVFESALACGNRESVVTTVGRQYTEMTTTFYLE